MGQSSFYQALIDLCERYLTEKCYAGLIPPKVEKRIREKFNIPDDEVLLAFFDFTIFSYAKDGFAVGANGLYWRETWTNTFLPWSKIVNASNIHIQKGRLCFQDNTNFSTAGCPLEERTLVELLTSIRDTMRPFIQAKSDAVQNENEQDSFEEALLRVCESHIKSKIYLTPLPEALSKKVHSSFSIEQDIEILVYFDFTFFGKGKQGVVFTKDGFYWRELSSTIFVSWLRLGTTAGIHSVKDSVILDSGLSLSCLNGSLKADEWVQLLQEINELPQMNTLHEESEALANSFDGTASQDSPMDDLHQAVRHILRSYDGDNIYKKGIPDTLMERVRKSFQVSAELDIWAYFDFLVFSKGKDGVLITELGIHWRIPFDVAFIPWSRLPRSEFRLLPEHNKILLNETTELPLHGSVIPLREWYDILLALQSLPHLNKLQATIVTDYPEVTHPLFDEDFVEVICRAHPFLDKLTDYALGEQSQPVIRRLFGIPDSERLVAYKDSRSGSRGEYGIAVTGRAICIRNKPDSNLCPSLYLPLADLHERRFELRHKSVFLGDEEIYQGNGSPSILPWLQDLQLYAESLKADEFPVQYPFDPAYATRWNLPVQNTDDERWIVAEDGMLRGIYGTSELQWAAETGQMAFEKTSVWKKGWSNWQTVQNAGFLVTN
ncbi:MAG TPA: hypothetical protein VE710_21400 [Candidatus Bathyarchaeia archaeon]|nr:hypothetical protein [Candidatus Bathyarchaeia archaeon]